MAHPLIEKWNGGKKAFLSALLGAVIGTIPAAIVVGQYKEKVDKIEVRLDKHIEEYTPETLAQFNVERTKIAVQQEQILGLKKSLEEIKQQNETIIRMLRNR